VQRAEAAVGDALEKLDEKRLATRRGNVLQHDERMHEVEAPFERREVIVALHQTDVGHAALGAVPLRLAKHRRRNVDADDRAAPARERNQQPSDAAAEVERGSRREGGIEPLAKRLPNGRDVGLARGEELFPGFWRELRPAVLFVEEDSEVRLVAAERLPVSVGVVARDHGSLDCRRRLTGAALP
jgi:hypothetical protein